MFSKHVAMGDPQAPFATMLQVLDHHGLLGPDGRLRGDVQLVSMGDHFDWGRPEHRKRATEDAVSLLAWLSSHAPEQVVLLAGNHDLARVCELWPFTDDAAFEAAHAEAAAIYRAQVKDPAREAAFLGKHPHLPDTECLARDYSCFSTEQQRQVIELLRTGRLRLAHAHAGLLLVHAGVTDDDFGLIARKPPADAAEAASMLNAFFDARVARWDGVEAFDLTPLHRPGTARTGEARGILYQRPAVPVPGDARFDGPPRRRFDPRKLPAAFPQAIGHVRDDKCRSELKGWCDDQPALDGVLRALSVDAETVRYVRGTPAGARLYFLDAGMNHRHAQQPYALFDLDTRAAL